MDKLYVLIYTDMAISDFRIFNNYNDALIEYLKSSIFETRKLLTEDIEDEDEDEDEINPQCIINEINEDDDEDDEDDDDDNEEDDNEYETCTLQIYEIESETSEFRATNSFDVDYFQDLIGENENLVDFLNNLEEKLNSNEIPSEISKAYDLLSSRDEP